MTSMLWHGQTDELFHPIRIDVDEFESIDRPNGHELENQSDEKDQNHPRSKLTGEGQWRVIISIGGHITIFNNGEM